MNNNMKKMKYISLALAVTFLAVSCEKHVIEFDSRPASEVALVQFHNEIPVPSGTAYNFLKIELNGVDVTHGNKISLSSWNTIPTALGRYYSTNPGPATIKLYQGTSFNLVYEQTVTLKAGKQGLILYDYNQPPAVVEEPDNYIPDRPSFDTDTVEYVRFFNLLRESPGVESGLLLQYQYQYTLHPLYTLEDKQKGLIPEGKNVGEATGDATKSPWLNLGAPVRFGEDTGWQLVPIKKTGYVTQGSARVDFRIKVTHYGTEGTDMTAGDNLLICYDRSSSSIVNGYTDYWDGTVGRRYYHFFSGYRTVTPGVDIVQFIEK
jgi:hypothetical protein